MIKFLKNLGLGKKIRSLFQKKVDEEAIEQLEKLFFEIDLGSELASDLTEKVRTLYKKKSDLSTDEALEEIRKNLITTLQQSTPSFLVGKPHVILVIGVNGNGKTTSVAKLAYHYKQQGKAVLIAATDTFRAAGIDQLEIWAKRLDVDIVKGKPLSDPASVAFDAIQAGKSRGHDIVIIDTAGRLHTREDLMQELEKIRRVMGKAYPGAPHETLLVLDATVGQNGIQQAMTFHQFTPISGLILTKLDGTAKGGTSISIQKKLNLPIKFIGIGEQLHDLELFEPVSFVNSLFE